MTRQLKSPIGTGGPIEIVSSQTETVPLFFEVFYSVFSSSSHVSALWPVVRGRDSDGRRPSEKTQKKAASKVL